MMESMLVSPQRRGQGADWMPSSTDVYCHAIYESQRVESEGITSLKELIEWNTTQYSKGAVCAGMDQPLKVQ